MYKLKISGLVKYTNQIKKEISRGIPPREISSFYNKVQETVKEVEKICRKAGSSPHNLPSPSRKAYEYLKSLKLETIPIARSTKCNPSTEFRINGIIKKGNQLQKLVNKLAEVIYKKSEPIDRDIEVLDMAGFFQHEVDVLEELLEENQQIPASLPIRSRNTFKWMKFLTRPENLDLHLQAVIHCLEILSDRDFLKQLPRSVRNKSISTKFLQSPNIYRVNHKKKYIEIQLSEGLIIADIEIIRYVLISALLMDKTLFKHEIMTFLQTEDYLHLSFEIDSIVEEHPENPIGHYHDLYKIFDIVNQEYFHNTMDRPKLTWNNIFTSRKFGHYQPSTDTVMVSISLDQENVPAYLVEFIMYHELLHKYLGTRLRNGRLYSHTSEFRKLEKKHKYYSESQALLTEIARS